MPGIVQVGAGSGGMVVLDLVCRDPRITHVTVLIASIVVAATSLLTWAISYSYGQLHTIAASVLPVVAQLLGV